MSSPIYKGHEDLSLSFFSSYISQDLFYVQKTIYKKKLQKSLISNKNKVFRSLQELTRHLKTRTYDNHATPVI